METYENIKYLREKSGLSQEQLAKLAGYSDRSSIAKIEAGKVDLSQSKISAFAKIFGVTPAELMGMQPDRADYLPSNVYPIPQLRKVPLLGNIACGVPILAEENIDEEVFLPENINADFALRCKGESMIGADILDGDIVYIKHVEGQQVINGKIYAVAFRDTEDEATLKHVYIDRNAGTLTLMADNPEFPPKMFSGKELENIQIIGRAVGFTRSLE